MSSAEYQDIVLRMERIERLLSRLLDGGAEPEGTSVARSLPVRASETDSGASDLQARGHFILETQGLKAYEKFWKEQLKQTGKPRARRKTA